MAVQVSEVRSETQVPASIVSDADITYAIKTVGSNGLYAVCSYVCQMVLRKYRGRTKIRVGNVWEDIDLSQMRKLIAEFDTKSGLVASDGVTEPDSFFTRDGI